MPRTAGSGLDKCCATAGLSRPAREVHLAVLAAFAQAGRALSRDELERVAVGQGADPAAVLAELQERDVIAFGADGELRAAYPFSPAPTPIQVTWAGGPVIHAMCAIDALGIPLMAGRDGTITSADPHSGEQVRGQRRDGTWRWEPDSTVVLAAVGGGCATAADLSCRNVSFYTSASHAEAYLRANPGVSGQILDQATAVDAAGILFGPPLGRT